MIPHFVVCRWLFLGSCVAMLSLWPETHLSLCYRDWLGFTPVWAPRTGPGGEEGSVHLLETQKERGIGGEGREGHPPTQSPVKTEGHTKSCRDQGEHLTPPGAPALDEQIPKTGPPGKSPDDHLTSCRAPVLNTLEAFCGKLFLPLPSSCFTRAPLSGHWELLGA